MVLVRQMCVRRITSADDSIAIVERIRLLAPFGAPGPVRPRE